MDPFPEYESFDAMGLAGLVRRGEVTPTELVEAAVARIEARNPALNAVIHPMFEWARGRAGRAFPDGPLAGVPLVLKDLHAALAGEPMTSACRFLRDYVPDHHSEVVARLERAGLVFVGKTNCPELGIMGVTEPALHGPTRNPWNTEYTPGGSSGGSGAAVAAGMTPVGHGGDGGGSIRIPASCCGLFGLKPTRGRIPVGPDMGESWCGFDSDAFLSRTVRDNAALLDATHGPDLGAPYVPPPVQRPFLEEVGRDPGTLRIAFFTGSLLGETVHPDCREAVRRAAALCAELGHRVEEAVPSFDRERMVRAYLTVVAASVALDISRAEELMGHKATPSGFEPETWVLGMIGRKTSARDLADAQEARHLAWRRIASFFEEYDILITSTLAWPPQKIGAGALTSGQRAQLAFLRTVPVGKLLDAALDELASSALERTANTMLFNMTGQPAISVPLHQGEDGLPIGVQFAGRFGAEATLLRLASQLEEAHPWKDRRPPGL